MLRGAGKAEDFPGIPSGNGEQEWNNSREKRAGTPLGRRRNLAQDGKDELQIPGGQIPPGSFTWALPSLNLGNPPNYPKLALDHSKDLRVFLG